MPVRISACTLVISCCGVDPWEKTDAVTDPAPDGTVDMGDDPLLDAPVDDVLDGPVDVPGDAGDAAGETVGDTVTDTGTDSPGDPVSDLPVDTPAEPDALGPILDCVCSSVYRQGSIVTAAVDNPSYSTALPAGTRGTALAGRTGWELTLLVEWEGWTAGHSGYCSYADCGGCVDSGTSRWWMHCADIRLASP